MKIFTMIKTRLSWTEKNLVIFKIKPCASAPAPVSVVLSRFGRHLPRGGGSVSVRGEPEASLIGHVTKRVTCGVSCCGVVSLIVEASQPDFINLWALCWTTLGPGPLVLVNGPGPNSSSLIGVSPLRQWKKNYILPQFLRVLISSTFVCSLLFFRRKCETTKQTYSCLL